VVRSVAEAGAEGGTDGSPVQPVTIKRARVK
jgi:hypothetical protein